MKAKLILSALLLSAIGLSATAQDTGAIYINGQSDAYDGTLNEALSAAEDNSTICIAGTLSYTNTLNIDKTITITSKDTDSPATLIPNTGNSLGMLLSAGGSLTLENITVDGNNVERAASVIEFNNSTNSILNNVTFSNFNVGGTGFTRSICELKGGGKMTATNLTFTNCFVISGNGLIFCGNNLDCTLSGIIKGASVYLENNNGLQVTNLDSSSGVIKIILEDDRTNSTIISGSNNLDLFEFEGVLDNYMITSGNDNISYAQIIASIGGVKFASLVDAYAKDNFTGDATSYTIEVYTNTTVNQNFYLGSNQVAKNVTITSLDPSAPVTITRQSKATGNMYEANNGYTLTLENLKAATTDYANMCLVTGNGIMRLNNIDASNYVIQDGSSIGNNSVLNLKSNATAYVTDCILGSVYVDYNGTLNLSGKNSFTINVCALNGNTKAKINVTEVLTNTTPIQFVDANETLSTYIGQVLIQGTTDASKFAVPAGYYLSAEDGNLVLKQIEDGYYLVGSMTAPYDGGFVPNPSYKFQPTSSANIYTLPVGSMSSSNQFYVMQVSKGVATPFSGNNHDSMIPTNTTDGNDPTEADLTSGNTSSMKLNNNYVNVIFTLTLDNGTPKTLSFEGTVDGSSWVISPGNDQTMQSGEFITDDNKTVLVITTVSNGALAYIYIPSSLTEVYYSVTSGEIAAADVALTQANIQTDNVGKFFTVSLVAGTEGTISVYPTQEGNAAETFYYKVITGIPTAVEGVEAAEGEARYFNLQGVEVMNPDHGIFIKVQNGKASKVIM